MLISMLITLVIVGVILYGINTITMDAKVKTIINAVVLIALILWVARSFGYLPGRF